MNDFLSAESAVCGAMLIDAGCISAVTGTLCADDFVLDANRDIFSAIVFLDATNEPVDAVKVLDRLQAMGSAADRGYLYSLIEITPTAANVDSYVKIVHEESRKRRLSGMAQEIVEMVRERKSSDEVMEHISRELEAMDSGSVGDLITPTEAIVRFFNYRDKLMTGGNLLTPTGISPVDRMLGGGFVNGGLYLLAARPGVGKTTLALTIADNVAKDSGPVLFVSLEMGIDQLTAKRIARVTGLSSTMLMTAAEINQEDLELYCKAGSLVGKWPVSVNRKMGCSVADVRAMARRIKGLRLIVVDYLGLLRPDNKSVPRYEAVTQISNDLKRLALSTEVPILALAQLNRANESRTDKKPHLSDLRDSGSLEQDADGVIMLHRDDYYEQQDEDIVPIDLMIEKNRHAGTGGIRLIFEKKTGRFKVPV